MPNCSISNKVAGARLFSSKRPIASNGLTSYADSKVRR
jgi:hypothetical protein